MISFNEKDIFLVTGGSSGMGQAAALRFNELGASVIISSRSRYKLEITKQIAKFPERVFIEPKDLMKNIDEHSQWIKDIAKKYGRLKGLVVFGGSAEITTLTMTSYEFALNDINTHYLAPLMLAKGFADRRVNTGSNCSIIFLSSVSAFSGAKGLVSYAGSESAIAGIVKSMANELFAKGIRVNVLSPGIILTDMTKKMLENGELKYLKDISHLIGKPEYVADTAVFLCSDNGQWINGQNIIIDGGSILPDIGSNF